MDKLPITPSMIFTNENRQNACKLVDGNPRTKWVGSQTPAYFELRFSTVQHIERVRLCCVRGSYCIFSVFASMDYVNFSEVLTQNSELNRSGVYELPCDFSACAVRFLIKYDSGSSYARVRDIALYGESTAAVPIRGEEPEAPAFAGSAFDRPITEQDTIDELHALVGRTIGTQYADGFRFVLQPADGEYFTICDADGKVQITANSGVNLAAGLGWYYKYCCKLHFSQVGCNNKLSGALPPVGKPIRRTTPFTVRYAYNYCALSYTMAFWGEEEWQEELDRLALQGVNVVLDITAIEEVWRRFLLRLGYSNDEARAFITGPAYYAWFNMANIYGTGAPVPLAYFKDRTALARRNHLFMRKLGMMPVLQGFSGMVPPDVKRCVPDAAILTQGLWNGMERPAMLRTNTDCYRRLAKLFYDCQKEVFGDNTIYFATDPFHEGGKSGTMNVSTIGKVIMETLLESYPQAVWILQSWGENPSRALIEGVAPYKEHVLVLDLYAEKKPHWESFLDREFLYTPWVYCMLNNFGGRMGLHGHLRTIANEIARAANTATCMKGVGITPEATFSNPVIFDLFFETIWTDGETIQPVPLDDWLRGYAERRYGSCPDHLYEALQLLNQTVYNPDLNENGEGAPESVVNARPALHPHSPSTWGNDIVAYDKGEFERAVALFAQHMDAYLPYAGYRFDLIDLLKQVLSNTAQEYQRNFAAAFEAKDVIEFRKWADKFQSLVALTNEVLSGEKTFLLGNWLNKAKARAAAYDDYSRQMFEFSARALITTWAGSRQAADFGGLRDYSNKQWAGLTKDFYAVRWQKWLHERIDELEGKPVTEPDWFRLEVRWVWERKLYADRPAALDLKALTEKVLGTYGVKSAMPDTLD